MRRRNDFSSVALCAGLPVLAWLATGCGSSDGDRFAAQTFDEFAQGVVIDGTDGGGGTGDDGGVTFPADAGGGFLDGGGPTGLPSGAWSFDDCSPSSPFLRDTTGNGANAQHPLHSSCVPGISGQAVDFHTKKDMVQIADEPQFTVSDRVAAAAWVNPRAVSGDQPIILKRLNDKTSFSLGIHSGKAEFSVVLSNGKTVVSRAPISPNVWTHVGGIYDGHFLFLFVNGQQVGQVSAQGTLRDVIAPIRIGATSQTQHFNGIIDEVWLSTNPVTGADIAALTCIHHPPTLAVSPATSGPVPPDTTVHYAVSVTDNDSASCQPDSYFLSIAFGGGSGGSGGGSTGADAGVGVPIGSPTPAPSVPPPPPVSFDGGAGVPDATAPPTDGSFPPPPPPPPPPDTDGLTIFANPSFIGGVTPGQTATFDISVTGSDDASPGTHVIPFTVFTNTTSLPGSVTYELTEGTGCRVGTARELMIRDTTVVDDPVRTAFATPDGTPHRGVWTFGRLMRDMAPSAETAPAFTEQLFRTWLTDQTVNGFTLSARPAMQQVVLDNWPRTANGALDLDRSPLRLLAIVDRMDLRDLAQGNAGEGRFVFGVLGQGSNAEQFTVILEYKLVASSEADVLSWANAWHDLSTHPFPSEEYNTALEALTLRFSGRGAGPGRPNGNALSQLRTNEISLAPRWEFRQFEISATSGALEPRPITLTPDLSFNGSDRLARFINQNEAAIIAEQHTIPAQFEGAPFLGGSVFNDLIAWNAPGIANNEARFHLSLNTCNGCHGSAETNTAFLHVAPRFPGQEANLSGFLTGTTVFDPVTGAPRSMSDLARRNADLKTLVCPAPPPVATPLARNGVIRAMTRAATPTIAKGISRVH